MESADKLSYKEIRDTIYETVQYARRIINEQKKRLTNNGFIWKFHPGEFRLYLTLNKL
jgi:mRNA-degrading endonuclease RelE of RelBE toxin-antitoxin system